MRIRATRSLRVGTALLALAAAMPAFGQAASGSETAAADEGNVNEIIVTARRTNERLQDVPLSVSVLTGEDLKRQQLDGYADIAKKTPGFSFEQFTGALAQTTIRGQTNLRTTSPVQNVTSYLNGIYLQRSYFIDQGVLDLERVEIIKGPQSALYGRNAFAGAINLQTRSPNLDDYSANVTGTAGTDERYDIKGGVNAPVIPGKLAIYAYGAHSEFDGTWRNNHPLANAKGPTAITRGKVGGYEKEAYQVGVKAAPTESLTVEGTYIHTKRTIEQVPAYTLSTSGLTYAFNSLNASPVAGQNRLWVGELPATVPGNTAGETRLAGLVIDPRTWGLRGPTDIGIGKAKFDPGGPFSLEYIFGYTKARITVRGSSARDPLRDTILGPPTVPATANYGVVFDSSGTGSGFKGYSHEARINYKFGETISGFLGFNYSKTKDVDSNASEFAPTNSLVDPDPAALFPVVPGGAVPGTVTPVGGTAATALNLFTRNTFFQRSEDVVSGFGYLDWRPTDKLAITLEGRYTIEDLRAFDRLARDVGVAFGGRGTGFLAPTPPTIAREAKYFTPRGSITYKLTEDNNIYASVARGYKSGGINGVAASYNRSTVITTGGVAAPALIDIVTSTSQPAPRTVPAGSTAAVTFTQTTTGTASLSGLQQFYAPETNWTYEVGTKNSFMGGGLILNAAAFLVNWKNLQSNAVRLNPDGTPPASFAAIVPSLIGNLGDVRVYGVDVDGSFRIAEPVRINFGATYAHSRYRSGTISQRFGAAGNCNGTVCATQTVAGFTYPVLSIAGNQLERTPEFTALAGATYDTKFANGWDFFLRGDVTYQTKQYADEANLAYVPSRTLVNASTGVTVGIVSAQLWVKNLFDKKYVSSSLFLIGTGGGLSATYVPILGEQRTMGLTASVRF